MTKEQFSKEIFEKLDSLSWEKCKDRIIFRLIPKKENIDENLEMEEFLPFLDLNLSLHIFCDTDNEHIATIRITKSIIEKWNVNPSQLYHYAKINTPKLLPVKIKNMFEYINENYNLSLDESIEQPNVLILTNEFYINGATSLAYPNVIDEIARKYDKNLIILPSSIHEVLILPDSENYENLEDYATMVRQVNETTVEEKDFLSDNAYYYIKEKKKFIYKKNAPDGI